MTVSSNTYEFHTNNFRKVYHKFGQQLVREGHTVDASQWQSIDVTNRPQAQVIELMNAVFSIPLAPGTAWRNTTRGYMGWLQAHIEPNLPWAEDHFLERIAGEPLNPGEQYKHWPYYKGNVEEHKEQGKFSHTYMERFWPKQAGSKWNMIQEGKLEDNDYGHKQGIRFAYGDLQDVINLLAKDPYTRQAFLPVWFPEDTGAVHGERVPCSLGYQFMLRQEALHVTYFIRSCDYVRHFRDDVYMAARLCQYVLESVRLKLIQHHDYNYEMFSRPGLLTMFMTSLHCFGPDIPILEKKHKIVRPSTLDDLS